MKKGTVFRRFITLPIGLRPTVIEFPIQRVLCLACGMTRQVKIGFAEPDRRYTKRFERYVLELSKHMTMTDVAHHLGISWHTVKEIQKRYLQRRFASPSLFGLQRIAVDEISIGHGHRYLTVVLDLDSGAVVFVGEGKGADALEAFWTRLKNSRAKIQAVAMDMSQAYICAVSTNLPGATIVFDHFHVIKLFNEKLTELRRQLYREATDLLQKEVLKVTRWLLLKNPENLNDDRNERARLEEALSINKPLAIAYYMKQPSVRRVDHQIHLGLVNGDGAASGGLQAGAKPEEGAADMGGRQTATGEIPMAHPVAQEEAGSIGDDVLEEVAGPVPPEFLLALWRLQGTQEPVGDIALCQHADQPAPVIQNG